MLAEIIALTAQAGLFLVGLALSLCVGIYLGAHLDGPGGLLIATGFAAAGLLGAAMLSQMLHDHLLEKEL